MEDSKQILLEAKERMRQIQIEAAKKIVGKRVKFISDYNGQPYGKSRPSLKGKTTIVKYVDIKPDTIELWDGDTNKTWFWLTDIEFME